LRQGSSRWHSATESNSSSQSSDCSATSLRGFQNQLRRDTTWASTSTLPHVVSSHMLQNFRSSLSKPGNYSNDLRQQAHGYPYKIYSPSRVMVNTSFSLSRQQDFSSASCTSYSATSGEAGSVSPFRSVATFNCGHGYPCTPTATTSTARSRQPTSTARV
jgi:hypothetical protein